MVSVPVSVLDLVPVRAGGTTADALAETLSFVGDAERLGAARYWFGEHHNIPAVAATSPAVLTAAAAAQTDTIRVGAGGVMLPNHSAYVAAEQFALLEALHPGRIDLGLGRAPGGDAVTTRALRRTKEGPGQEDFADQVELVLSWLGPRGVRVGRGHELRATPRATSHPEVWLLGTTGYSANLAARLGLRYAFGCHLTNADPIDALTRYRTAFRPSAELHRPHAMLCTSALVGATTEEAHYLAGPSTVAWLDLRRELAEPLPTPEDAGRRLAEADLDGFAGTQVIGTADAVRARLTELVARTGVAELMIVTTAHDPRTRVETLAAILD